jgi:hypothetical protein
MDYAARSSGGSPPFIPPNDVRMPPDPPPLPLPDVRERLLVPAGGGTYIESSYFFELQDTDAALEAELLIDEMPAEALRSRVPRLARWRWAPGFHAGVIEAVLKLPGGVSRRVEIVTDPDTRKLTRHDFDTMVRELLEDTFALFSLSAFRKGIAREVGTRPPAIARLEFLRSRVDEIVETIAAISHHPRHFLGAEDIAVPWHRANRATGPEILRSFRSGRMIAETSDPPRLPAVLRGRLPAHIRLRQRRSSLDIPEHRQMKACLRSWAGWLANAAAILERITTRPDHEIATTAATWAMRSRRLARRISEAAAAPMFAEVGEGPARLVLSSLFRRDPVYGRFYRLWQDMNLGLAVLFGDFLQMPIARTYELYELWCYLRLVRAAAEEYGPAGLDLASLFTADAAGGLTVASGAVSVDIGGEYKLCFQRQYREFWLEADGRGSFSRTMVPDIAVSGPRKVSGERRLIVLDANYRIDASLNEALNSIHTYRDALVQEAATGRIEGIVTAAYLLTPHVPELGADYRATQLVRN